jgi:pyruvyl transferase EpsO
MIFSSKNDELRKEIAQKLIPLITNDYWLLELPYYRNIGDILIWYGTEFFLKTFNARCKYKSSFYTFKKKKISANIIILLQGGGNFGDLWDGPQDFRRRIIKDYPNNKIIILPQTIFYSNENNLISDAKLFSMHKKLVICARDEESLKILKNHFSTNTILLVPDMAFCIPAGALKKIKINPSYKTLFVKRTDQEINTHIDYFAHINENNIDISDWPPMEKETIVAFLLRCFLWINRRMHILFSKITDLYACYIFKQNMIKIGVRFISKYKKIYTTRLHAAILCCILEKPFILFNNSYGKNSSFFKTWFSDLDDIEFH